MIRKSLMIAATSLMILSPLAASADVVTNSTGIEINKKTSVKLAYDLAVTDLSSDDYRISVVPSDNANLNKDALNKTIDIGNGDQVTGAVTYKNVIKITLTDSGKAKVAAETGVSDPDSIAVIAEIPGDNSGSTPTYSWFAGTDSDKAPDISTPIVVATHTAGSGDIDSTSDLQEKIVDAKAAQDKAQANHEISSNGQKLLDKAGIGLRAGADIASPSVNTTQLHRSVTYNKKAFDKAENSKKWHKVANVGWRFLGVLILVGLASGVAFIAWKIQNKKREN